MEMVVKTISVHDNEVYGCTRFKKDVMIAISDGKDIHDFFLDQEQAEKFYNELEKVVKYNENIR